MTSTDPISSTDSGTNPNAEVRGPRKGMARATEKELAEFQRLVTLPGQEAGAGKSRRQ